MPARTMRWNCAGHSATGTSHVAAQLPCQDCFGHSPAGSPRRILAIADGAGSAKHPEEGARHAVAAMIRALSAYDGKIEEITEEQGAALGAQVRGELQRQCEEAGVALEDFACTLLAAAFEDDTAYFWQIGDGAWLLESPAGIACATRPVKGEFHNQTSFITSANWEQHWQHAVFNEAIAAMGFTDGLEMFCLEPRLDQAHLPFVGKIFAALQGEPEEDEIRAKIEGMLGSPVITSREDDDLTLALAWRGREDVP